VVVEVEALELVQLYQIADVSDQQELVVLLV
jgi:hypothetical protein